MNVHCKEGEKLLDETACDDMLKELCTTLNDMNKYMPNYLDAPTPGARSKEASWRYMQY
jgi:hypothetical protein